MPMDFDSLPMRLFRASQERAWTASAIDYSRERADWMSLDAGERELLLRLVSGFRVGERGVTHELAPLQQRLREERRIEEELYVTAQMFEEARHVEFFERWLQEALPGVFGRDIAYPPLVGDLFSERLPQVMRALHSDPSPEAQLRAVLTYHFFVEGVGAESAYPIYFDIFERTAKFPGLAAGIQLIRRDEARHIAFGTYLLQRLLAENPRLGAAFERELEAMRPQLDQGADQTFAPFEGGPVPFGLDPSKYRRLYRENFELQRRNVLERQLAAAVV